MSTVPGSDAWRDAGLEPVEPVPTRLVDDLAPPDPDEYTPDFPRPDLDGTADEADVVEQDDEVPLGDDGGEA
jgi:hypothetical protein